MSNIPSDSYLAKFPRPENDNGRAVHFTLDLREDNLSYYIPLMRQMQMKWTVVYGSDENTTVHAAKRLMDEAGVMSIIRIQATGEMPKNPSSWAGYVRHAIKNGVTPYFQIFNEMEDGREGFDSPEHASSLWQTRANVVAQEGGYPGLSVLSEDFFAAACGDMSDAVKERFFFSAHCYTANHPPAYPYDIGKTAIEDDTCWLRFLAYEEWFKKYLGFVPPMIMTEGGTLYENHDDKTYPPAKIDSWVDWHKQFYDSFRTGILPNGMPLPDYLFNTTSWLLSPDAGWYSDAWFGGLHSSAEYANERDDPTVFKQDLVKWLETSTPFIRQFGQAIPDGETPMPPPPVGQTLEEAVLVRANQVNWMPVNNGAALWNYAQANGLQDQQTDELQLFYQGETYIAQVFNKGIVYAPLTNVNDIKVIPT